MMNGQPLLKGGELPNSLLIIAIGILEGERGHLGVKNTIKKLKDAGLFSKKYNANTGEFV